MSKAMEKDNSVELEKKLIFFLVCRVLHLGIDTWSGLPNASFSENVPAQ